MMKQQLKNLARPIYYALGLDRSAYWYLGKLGFKTDREISIGNNRLVLDRAVRHENAYYLDHVHGVTGMDEILASVLLREGDVVLDAGANIGFLAAVFASYGAREVYCFEPVAAVFNKLSRVRSPAIRLFNAGLSDHDGDESIFVSTGHNQGSSLKSQFLALFPHVFGARRITEKIKVVKLDSVLADVRFDFMKVDIEGSELDFLRGAAGNIGRHPPRILQIESYPLVFTEVNTLLSSHYRFCARVNTSKARNGGLMLSKVDEVPPGFDSTDNFLYFNDTADCPFGLIPAPARRRPAADTSR